MNPLAPNPMQQELNTIQQMQMLILQEQQTLDATLKDENPNDRFKRYQAAYAKILQHQSSYGQQASQMAQMAAPTGLTQPFPSLGQPNAMMNPMMNPMFNQLPSGLLNQTNMMQFNAQQQAQVQAQQQAQAQAQANGNTTSIQPGAGPGNSSSNPAIIDVPTPRPLTLENMDTSGVTSPLPNLQESLMNAMSPAPKMQDSTENQSNSKSQEGLSSQGSATVKSPASVSKSNATDNSSVTGDSALGTDRESLQQSMTNSRAHANRIKEGVVASAAQLTPGLFSNSDNIREFLGLAENPQIHVPCTAKCYHKCKLGISCPRHAHKHHERKIRKQKQAAAAAAAAAAASGNTSETDSATNANGKSSGSCKGNKSIETTSSMSVCSDTFNNLDKKSGKDGKKRTFLDLYEVYNVIGVGGGGMVYSGRRIQDKLPVAIKRVMREKVKRWETVQGYQVPQEIALMLRCYGHPGIIKLVDWYECLDSFILIMERPERAVDLFDYIREIGRVPEKEAAIIFKQILEAAIHIQNCGVVHRDIKDENIIINRDTMEAKLIDFGCGTLLKDGPYRDFSGTPEFYPPEWFVDREYYARTACVWSLGVLLFDMTQGEIPFKQKEKIVENKPTYKQSISDHCQNLIRWCMNSNQNSRPSLEQIQCHMWVMLNCFTASPQFTTTHHINTTNMQIPSTNATQNTTHNNIINNVNQNNINSLNMPNVGGMMQIAQLQLQAQPQMQLPQPQLPLQMPQAQSQMQMQPNQMQAQQVPMQQSQVPMEQIQMQMHRLLQMQQPLQPDMMQTAPLLPQMLVEVPNLACLCSWLAGNNRIDTNDNGLMFPVGSMSNPGGMPPIIPGSTRWADEPLDNPEMAPQMPAAPAASAPQQPCGGAKVSISAMHFPEPSASAMVQARTTPASQSQSQPAPNSNARTYK